MRILLFLFTAAAAVADISWIPVKPSDTDPRIHGFDTPHWVCFNAGGVDRHQLLVFLPGTFGHRRAARLFLETAADLGYRCIDLMYPDDIAAAQVCANDPDPHAFERFRMAIIAGGPSPHIDVNEADSIESRLTHLLAHLQANRPDGQWGQFLRGGGLAWDRIAVSGLSQGGGHAGLIGVKHRVARVIMFGAPKDFSRALNRPARWYYEAKATPPAAFFAVNHRQDRQGCSFREQLLNLRALGLDRLGPVADVDRLPPPYAHSHILVTNYPGRALPSLVAHGTPVADRNVAVFRPVWVYMLTGR